ncbi:3-hydroxyisobutyrate dehydrogenase [Dasania sp. GY-MA-18]|uniref:3-hydroxyisobutyrate dehydrogenase n=1 Tax=Dasania phycosphaerae TaxID=2950436 RepID=A0A9J6RSP4_9GAMM|nr:MULTISPECIES: 3-hydroxyisobutyrate dehydrogenase [Dasania]MCR8924434.1 3-hydroxyisobutyrate dehydrogenase [Dasania sp. GY-MA-18]MCZ0867109.1 3-hydroxyisobutyrate dehydrogenase [Dasania phycosphaerae]MCZ0870561.1 3-hydroxyisobutyrate dehydrogenase [Dasania phycosphaerae]
MSSTIAFIGLGNMGGSMAANLVKAGYSVRAYDLSPAALNQAQAAGCYAASSALDCISSAQTVITMLTSGEIVEQLYLHDPGLFNQLSPTTLVIDCSTIAPQNSQHLAQCAAAKKLRCIDAPVSGGTAGAAAATLTFICGGEADDVALAKPILLSMGQQVFHAGGAGAGQIAKACNNMLLAIQMAGTAEALQMGVNSGLDASTLSEIMHNSSGNNWVLDKYNPYPGVMPQAPASHQYQPGFMVKLMLKDLAIAMQTAQHSRSDTPLGLHAQQLFEQLQSSHPDYGDKDFSSIQRLYQPPQTNSRG